MTRSTSLALERHEQQAMLDVDPAAIRTAALPSG